MRTIYKLMAAAALFAPGIVLAQGAEHRFTHRGATYVYTVTPDAHGRQVIAGRRLADGSAFRLIVDGDRVEGVSGGQNVTFRTPRPVAVRVAAN